MLSDHIVCRPYVIILIFPAAAGQIKSPSTQQYFKLRRRRRRRRNVDILYSSRTPRLATDNKIRDLQTKHGRRCTRGMYYIFPAISSRSLLFLLSSFILFPLHIRRASERARLRRCARIEPADKTLIFIPPPGILSYP